MIRVTLDGAAVGTGVDAALPPVSASYASGVPTLLATEGGNRPTVLSLVASGRMKLDAGSVTAQQFSGAEFGGAESGGAESGRAESGSRLLTPAQLRRAVALIDTPLVAEHSDDVSVATVVREELAFTKGHGSGSSAAKYPTKRPFGSLDAHDRLELLIDLALRRPDVSALVITSPERHGGEPARWWRLLRATASRGVAVLVVTDHATVAHLTTLSPAEAVFTDASAVSLFDLTESR